MNAAAHVACSLDVGAQFELLPFQRQALPELPPRPSTAEATSPALIRPLSSGGARLPSSANLLTLAREVNVLENRNATLERQLALHAKPVSGFCALYSPGR